MHQINTHTALSLSKIHCHYKTEYECCLVDWIKQHARAIAEIETKRRDKTNCGTWMKGWKTKMQHDAANQAEMNVLKKFVANHCMMLDGIIWLQDLKIIESLKPPLS